MPTVALIAPCPLAGKTTIAAALSRFAPAALKRTGEDDHASVDAETFSTLSSADGAVTVVEASGGEAAAEAGATVVVVAPAEMAAADVAAFCNKAGTIAGLAVNRVPTRRAYRLRESYEKVGLKLLAMIPEDRVLAAPTLADVSGALEAEASNVTNGAGRSVIYNPVVASIASDPGQGYFTREDPSAVIVRSDKPDLQLSAINAGAPALIITGGLPILSYVLDRAESDEIPILRTALDTAKAVETIEGLFGEGPFAGGEKKLRRVQELVAGSDLAALVG
jgi:BioD-like phosphotransacetylase family protein